MSVPVFVCAHVCMHVRVPACMCMCTCMCAEGECGKANVNNGESEHMFLVSILELSINLKWFSNKRFKKGSYNHKTKQ